MKSKLHLGHGHKKRKTEIGSNLPTQSNENPKQPLLIQDKTLIQYTTQLKLLSLQIKALQTRRYSSKSPEWLNLKAQINQVLGSLKLKRLRKIFERKFEEEIRLLNDFYTKKYHQSMFKLCFFCCPAFILREIKHYKFIDDVFEVSLTQVDSTQRHIYFYVTLLYLKLFAMLVTLTDRVEEQFNKKMIEAMTVQSKQTKIIENRKKEVGEIAQINDVFVMEEDNFKQLDNENKIVASYIIQSDNPAQIKGKLQPRQDFDVSLMKKNHYDDFKQVQKEIQTIILNDWKEIINCEEWISQSYYGFIQIDSEPPIETPLQFKDCKLKTSHLFNQISSSSFDLRTYLVRKSKSKFKRHHYILEPLNEDSVDFKLRFWLSQVQRTDKNHENIQKFLLLTMRIGVKQKIYRTCNMHYKKNTKKWMIHNYVHMSLQKNDSIQLEKDHKQNQSQYRSFSDVTSGMTPQMFWWVNLGSNLIRAIVEVADKKKIQRKNNLIKMKKAKSSSNKNSPSPNEKQYNPESIDRLVKPPSLSKKNHYRANQI